MRQIFYNKSSVVYSFRRMISVSKYLVSDVTSCQQTTLNDKNNQKDMKNVSNTQKVNCLDEKQNKQDEQSSNVNKATKQMNDNYD